MVTASRIQFVINSLDFALFLTPDDSWLTVTPQQLDDMLSASYKSAFQEDADTHDLGRVAKSVKAFVGKVSSHEGAEFPRLEHRPQNFNLCIS